MGRAVATYALIGSVACAVTFRDVPPGGTNEWREYLGSTRRGPGALERLDSAPSPSWQSEVGRGVIGAPAVGDQVTTIASIDRWVHAIDTRTGALFWRFRGPDAFGVGPVMGGGFVYAATEAGDGFVIALDLVSGKRRWQARTGPIGSPLVLRDSSVYAVNQIGTVLALDARDGRQRQTMFAGPTRGGVLVGRAFSAVMSLNDSLFVFETATGRPVARIAIPVGATAPLAAIDEHTVALASPGGAVLAIALPSGPVLWRVDTGAPVAGPPVVRGDTVFALTTQCGLWAIPVTNAGAAASVPLGCRTAAAPLLLGNGVLVATIDGDIIFHDRSAGAGRWTLGVGGELRHPPTLQQGRIIIAPALGPVVSFR